MRLARVRGVCVGASFLALSCAFNNRVMSVSHDEDGFFKLDEDYFSADHSSHITSSYYPERLIMLACSKKDHSGNRLLHLLRKSLTELTKSKDHTVETAKIERIL